MWPWQEVAPVCSAARARVEGKVTVCVPYGGSATAEVELEDGRIRALAQTEDFTEPREVDGILAGQTFFVVPPDLPLGYHILRA